MIANEHDTCKKAATNIEHKAYSLSYFGHVSCNLFLPPVPSQRSGNGLLGFESRQNDSLIVGVRIVNMILKS